MFFTMKHEERTLQAEVINLLRVYFAKLPDPKPLVFSNHNNANNIVSGMLARSQGRLSGIPDLTILCNRGKCLFIELKTKKGRASKEQIAMHKRIEALGYSVRTFTSAKDVEEWIQKHATIHSLGTTNDISKNKILVFNPDTEEAIRFGSVLQFAIETSGFTLAQYVKKSGVYFRKLKQIMIGKCAISYALRKKLWTAFLDSKISEDFIEEFYL